MDYGVAYISLFIRVEGLGVDGVFTGSNYIPKVTVCQERPEGVQANGAIVD